MQVTFTFGRITPTGVQILHQSGHSTKTKTSADADTESAYRLLEAIVDKTPAEHELLRSLATQRYAMQAETLEGSET